MRMRPNYPVGTAVPPPLLLDGRKDLTLVSLKVNGAALPEGSVQVREKRACLCDEFSHSFDSEYRPP